MSGDAPGAGSYLLAERYELPEPPVDGRIQQARDRLTRREVQLKSLCIEDPARRRRFQEEGKVLVRVRHPAIMDIHDVVVEEGSPWVTFSLVPETAPTLERTLAEEKRLRIRRAVRLAADLAWGLSLLHRERMVYGDLDPSRVHLRPDDREQGRLAGFDRIRGQGGEVTFEGRDLPGNPLYLAPEQIRGHRAGREADLFSLGCILYAMLTGRPPAWSDRAEEIPERQLAMDAPELIPGRFGVPGAVKSVLRDLLRQDPARRPTLTATLAGRIEAAWEWCRHLPWC